MVNVYFVVILILIFLNVYIEHKRFEKMNRKLSGIIERLDNGVLTDLKRILVNELKDLHSYSNAEKGLWIYFNRKVKRMYNVYNDIKKDLNNMNNEALIDSLKTGSSEMRVSYTYLHDNLQYSYPEELLQFVDFINEVSITKFRKYVLDEFSLKGNLTKIEKLEIVKSTLYDCFQDNIRSIYRKFIETKNQIKDVDFLTSNILRCN